MPPRKNSPLYPAYLERERERSRARQQDPEYRRKRAEAASKRWLAAKEDPERLETRRQQRRDSAKRRRALDPYRGMDPEDFKATCVRYAHERRARKYQADVEYVDRNEVFETASGVCGICNEEIEGEFHVDHIVPLSLGGSHTKENCQPAHPFCNLSKGNRVD